MFEHSFLVSDGGDSSAISISGTSTATTNPVGKQSAWIIGTVDFFIRKGTSPTAVVNVDRRIPAAMPFRATGLRDTDKLAFVTDGSTGTVYVTPEDI